MKVLSRVLVAAALTTASTGCEKFLDINQNPNAFTPESITPDVIMAQALNTTASLYSGGIGGAANSANFNSYASWAVGYLTKTSTVNGYGEEQTYNYSNSYYAGLFDLTYTNLNDYNIIQARGKAVGYPNHAAIARIMKAYDFLLLVDEYGDIPYSQALQGAGKVTPGYDSAKEVYKDLLVQLTTAIGEINAAGAGARSVGVEDIVFAGDMAKWKKFANSLKLRILLRESQTGDAAIDADVRTQLTALQNDPEGFITSDVVAQPGYSQNTNQQNPLYTRYGYTAAGTSATERNYQVPTQYVLDQYNNNNDPRISQIYTLGAAVPSGGGAAVTGYVGGILGELATPTTGTATATTRKASRFFGQEATTPGGAVPGGIFKGVNQPTPLMLLSEQLFNQAEAITRSLFIGTDATAKQAYLDGIKASFIFYYRPTASGLAVINAPTYTLATLTTSNAPGIAQYNTYIATTATGGTNAANPRVNFDMATNNGVSLGKQAIIIFQKYLATNLVASTEAWDDYRRTGLPNSPIALQASQGKFPTRLLYPLSETGTNLSNIPKGTDQYTRIFWQKQ